MTHALDASCEQRVVPILNPSRTLLLMPANYQCALLLSGCSDPGFGTQLDSCIFGPVFTAAACAGVLCRRLSQRRCRMLCSREAAAPPPPAPAHKPSLAAVPCSCAQLRRLLSSGRPTPLRIKAPGPHPSLTMELGKASSQRLLDTVRQDRQLLSCPTSLHPRRPLQGTTLSSSQCSRGPGRRQGFSPARCLSQLCPRVVAHEALQAAPDRTAPPLPKGPSSAALPRCQRLGLRQPAQVAMHPGTTVQTLTHSPHSAAHPASPPQALSPLKTPSRNTARLPAHRRSTAAPPTCPSRIGAACQAYTHRAPHPGKLSQACSKARASRSCADSCQARLTRPHIRQRHTVVLQAASGPCPPCPSAAAHQALQPSSRCLPPHKCPAGQT